MNEGQVNTRECQVSEAGLISLMGLTRVPGRELVSDDDLRARRQRKGPPIGGPSSISMGYAPGCHRGT